MAKDPAFLFYSKDFFEGTRMMMPDERAAYVDLLTYQHQNGYIPDDPKRLSMYCTGVSEATIKSVLEAKFKLCLGQGWINEKLSQVTEERKEHSHRQSVNGTVGQFWKKSRAVLKDADFLRLKKFFAGKNNEEILEIIEGKEVNEAMLIAMLKQEKEAKRKHLEDASAIENADAIAIENEKGGVGEKTNSERSELRSQQSEARSDKRSIASRMIGELNLISGRKHDVENKKSKSRVERWLKSGVSEQEMIEVMELKWHQWRQTDFEMYMRPETLFGEKFSTYLEEVKSVKNGTIKLNQNGNKNANLAAYERQGAKIREALGSLVD